MNTELMSGSGSDLIMMDGLSVEAYGGEYLVRTDVVESFGS